MIDRKRTACFTGHRNIPTHHRQQLTELLDRMIEALYRKGVVFYRLYDKRPAFDMVGRSFLQRTLIYMFMIAFRQLFFLHSFPLSVTYKMKTE